MKKAEIKAEIEKLLVIYCCHTTGTHDPEHFTEEKYVCRDQMAEALERLCNDLGIEKIPVRSDMKNCHWCQDYKEYRKEYIYDLKKKVLVFKNKRYFYEAIFDNKDNNFICGYWNTKKDALNAIDNHYVRGSYYKSYHKVPLYYGHADQKDKLKLEWIEVNKDCKK